MSKVYRCLERILLHFSASWSWRTETRFSIYCPFFEWSLRWLRPWHSKKKWLAVEDLCLGFWPSGRATWHYWTRCHVAFETWWIQRICVELTKCYCPYHPQLSLDSWWTNSSRTWTVSMPHWSIDSADFWVLPTTLISFSLGREPCILPSLILLCTILFFCLNN